MSPRRKPISAVSYHATQRAQQRWAGADISIEEVERQLASGEAEVYERENDTIWKILIAQAAVKIPIVYNRKRKVVITVLPETELIRIQQELGAGLTWEQRSQLYQDMSPDERIRFNRRKAQQELLDPNYNIGLVRRAQRRMALIDGLPADVRSAVHEYGHEIIWEFWCHGVRSGDDIVILIEAARRSASAFSPSLFPLYRHFGVCQDKAIKHLTTAARMENAPTAPDQTRYGMNRAPNRKANVLSHGSEASA